MRAFIFVAALAATAAVVAFAIAPTGGQAPPSSAAPPAMVDVAAPAPAIAAAPADRPSTTRRARYALHHSTAWTIDGAPSDPIVVTATWDTEAVGDDWRIRIADATVTAHEAMPDARALAGAYGLRTVDGALHALSFPADADALSRRTFGALAAAFWMTPGAGAAWSVEEDDLAGRYIAHYTREGDTVVKTVERYVGLRGAQGLDPRPARQAQTGGRTTFQYDEQGLRRAVVDTTLEMRTGEGGTHITTHIRGELRRLDDVPPALAALVNPFAPFSALVDFTGHAEQRDMDRVDGATAADLLAELQRVEALGRNSRAGRLERNALLKRLSALVRLDPAAIDALTAEIRDRAARGEDVGLLVGALASARDASATDALAAVVGDLDGPLHQGTVNTLGLAHEATSESMRVLSEELDGQSPLAAAMALGNQARRIADADPDAAAAAVSALGERFAAAESTTEKKALLQALANAGDREALPTMMDVIENDPALRGLALRGLRFMPGEDVDALLEQYVRMPGQHTLQALEAVGYREGGRWAPVLTEVQQMYRALGKTGPEATAVDTLLGRFAAATEGA